MIEKQIMLRSILAIFAGLLVGVIVVWLVELPGMVMHPLPSGTNMSDSEAMKSHFAKAPTAALAGIAIAWTIGPLVGSWLAALIARRAFLAHALVVGVVFVAWDMMNVFSFPHPIWLAVVGIIAPLISSFLGASLAARMCGPAKSGPQPYDMREKNMAC